jgi:hypothetical protein
LETHFKIIDH